MVYFCVVPLVCSLNQTIKSLNGKRVSLNSGSPAQNLLFLLSNYVLLKCLIRGRRTSRGGEEQLSLVIGDGQWVESKGWKKE